MKHCSVCTYKWKCTARVKCLLGKIKADEIEIEMPDPIPVKTTRGVTMSNNVVKMPKKRGRKKKDA